MQLLNIFPGFRWDLLRPAGYSVDDYTRKEVWFWWPQVTILFGDPWNLWNQMLYDGKSMIQKYPKITFRFDRGWAIAATHFRSFLHISWGYPNCPSANAGPEPTQNVGATPCAKVLAQPHTRYAQVGNAAVSMDPWAMSEWQKNHMTGGCSIPWNFREPRFHLSCRVDDFFWGV